MLRYVAHRNQFDRDTELIGPPTENVHILHFRQFVGGNVYSCLLIPFSHFVAFAILPSALSKQKIRWR